ncbi:MAG: hypothetical protein IJ809_05870 [Clostridia bacterium]|nr:hypothetical protein [Clostridia bacterium]
MIELGDNFDTFKFASFNNFREEKYRLVTKMQENEVIKSGNNEHIKSIGNNIDILNSLGISSLDRVENGMVISSYCNGNTLEEIMIKKILNEEKINEFFEEIDRYAQYIKEKMEQVDRKSFEFKDIFSKYSIEVEERVKDKFTYIKHGFIDMTFDNIFVIENNYFVYDQEWYEENVPLEYMLYRAINRFFFNNKQLRKIITEEEVYARYGLTDYLELFRSLENAWQKKIVDRNVLSYFESTYSATTSLESLKNSLSDLEFFKSIVEKQKEYITQLENENEELKKKR